MLIRLEEVNDAAQVRQVVESAFGRTAEADLVEALRRNHPEALSLVADDGLILGHVLLTPATVDDGERRIVGMGLAPLAVRADRQRRGVGSKLVARSLEILREHGCPFVVVLGHPEYYPRFGFERASKFGLASQWPGVRDEAFMALILDRNAVSGVSGVVRYRDEFNALA